MKHIYTDLDGSYVVGYQAKFICNGDGIDIKIEIESLADINNNDWTSLWITTFEDENIKIGIGDRIGHESDVIFSFGDFDNNHNNLLSNTLIGSITSSQSQEAEWKFYDYSNSTTCDIDIVTEYNISTKQMNYIDKYSLSAMEDKHIPSYLWKNNYWL